MLSQSSRFFPIACLALEASSLAAAVSCVADAADAAVLVVVVVVAAVAAAAASGVGSDAPCAAEEAEAEGETRPGKRPSALASVGAVFEGKKRVFKKN